MPIHELVENLGVPIKGTIRLGVRKETSRGAEYPDTTEYFVLTDAPEVEAYYGKEPTSLDICFPGDNLDAILSTWYKYWSPSIKEGNTVKRGSLICKGTGPCRNEAGNPAPGEATWYDRKRLPASGVSEGLQPGAILQRECWGKQCLDAFDSRGNPKCKQTMQIFCILPLVSLGDIYVISTTSWESMRSFHRLLRWHQKAYGPAYVAQNPYRVYREARKIPYIDTKSGARKESLQYIMFLQGLNRDQFELAHKDRLVNLRGQLERCSMTRYLTSDTVPELPMEDLYPCIEAPKETELTPLQKSEALLEDSEVVAAFMELEHVTGTAFDRKARLMGIRMRENAEDQKAAVLQGLTEKIAAVSQKKQESAVETTSIAEPVSGTSTPEPSLAIEPEPLDEMDLGLTELSEEDSIIAKPSEQPTLFN